MSESRSYAYEEMLENQIKKLLEDADSYEEKDWIVLYDANKGGRSELLSSFETGEIRSKIRHLYWAQSEHLRRIVRNGINYIVGTGMQFLPEKIEGDETETIKDAVLKVWDRWCRANHWPDKQKETVERGYLDGEIFYRFKERDNLLRLRFLEPEDVNDPTPASPWTHGIKFNELDVEEVEAYAWNPKHATDKPLDWIAANEVQHIFWFGTRSMVRGLPPLATIANRVKQYDTWLHDRLILNKLRSRIALLRKHLAASPSQVAAFADRTKDGVTKRSAKTGEEMDRRRMFKAGTIVDTHGKTEYEFLTPNLQAADVRHDGRAVLLAIAAGGGQSEVMVSADAANANFASTWIAEAPPVREFELYQGVCLAEFEMVWHRVMIWAQETGAIPTHPDRDDAINFSGYKVSIVAPRLIVRDRFADTQANEKMYNAECLSRDTWMMRDDLDPEVEKERIEEDRANDVGLGHTGEEEEEEEEEEEKNDRDEEKPAGTSDDDDEKPEEDG